MARRKYLEDHLKGKKWTDWGVRAHRKVILRNWDRPYKEYVRLNSLLSFRWRPSKQHKRSAIAYALWKYRHRSDDDLPF